MTNKEVIESDMAVPASAEAPLHALDRYSMHKEGDADRSKDHQ